MCTWLIACAPMRSHATRTHAFRGTHHTSHTGIWNTRESWQQQTGKISNAHTRVPKLSPVPTLTCVFPGKNRELHSVRCDRAEYCILLCGEFALPIRKKCVGCSRDSHYVCVYGGVHSKVCLFGWGEGKERKERKLEAQGEKGRFAKWHCTFSKATLFSVRSASFSFCHHHCLLFLAVVSQ